MASDEADFLGNILGSPVTITSGYRSPQHNALVGGVPNSAHLTGQAYDFVPQGMSMADAQNKIVQSGVPFDQLINERDHVHVSFDPKNRRQVIGQKVAGISDADLMKALTSDAPAAAPSAPQGQASGISDDQLLAALTGDKPKAAPTTNYYPPGDSRNGPAAVTVGGGGQAQSTQALPPKFSKDSGIAGSLGLPFLQDVMAGMATAEDVAGNALTGRPGMSIGDTFQARSQELQDRSKEFQAQYPGMKNAWVLGMIPAGEAAAPNALAKAAEGLPALMKAGAKSGAIYGGLAGLGTPSEDGTLSGRLQNAETGAGVGAATGFGLPVIGKGISLGGQGIGKLARSLSEKFGLTTHDAMQEAQNMLLRAFGHDGTNAPAASSQLAQTGKPLTIMDVGGTNTQRLARKLVTQPGQAGEKITKFLTDRADSQSSRVIGDIKGHLSQNTDVYGLGDKLLEDRSNTSGDLFKDAFAGGSTAPLESQFRKELTSATGVKGTIAKQIKEIETNNPGALAARGAAGKGIRDHYMQLRADLDAAEKTRVDAQNRFQQAKQDGSANAPGAIWSTRLQEFLDNPEVQSGLKSGLKLEKQDAITEGRKFKDSEFSIVGTDEHGDPILGAVPTMKSLAVAKESLDARILQMVDPNTHRLTKAGLSLKKFRDAFVNELDRLNPKYQVARNAWSGPSQSREAIEAGRDFLNQDPEEINKALSKMTDSDKDFFRIGAARSIQDRARSASDSTDLSRHLFGKQELREQIEAAFGKGSADAFGEAMGHEGRMAATNRFVLGGSNTANKLADFTDPGELVAHDMLHGGLVGGPKGAVIHAGINAARRGISSLFDVHPETAAALGDILIQKGETAVPTLNRLLGAQAKKAARSKSRQGAASAAYSLAAMAAGRGAASSSQ